MTDLERFIELYRSFGIECKVNSKQFPEENVKFIILGGGEYAYDEDMITKSNKFTGYSGFYSFVEFDENGNFRNQGFWE